MSESGRQLAMFTVLLVSWLSLVLGHGRLWQPPARGTMWRRGYGTPINYNDNQLFCGGFNHLVMRGHKCGLCGDPYDGVREHETGGKYAKGIIARTYTQAQSTVFQVDLTAGHRGYFEFKICPTNNPKVKESQDCFDKYPVSLAASSGSGTKYPAPLAASSGSETKYYVDNKSGKINIEVQLPPDLSCSFCVLQWRYHTGNSWGTDPDGKQCLGCGYQEEFYGCADIEILPSKSN